MSITVSEPEAHVLEKWSNGDSAAQAFLAVEGRISLRRLNLDGDRQADLSVHGGQFKAVYCYPIEHYDRWTKELDGRELPTGMFGDV
jgi:MOSC domain-containing protein YiiM